MLMRILALVCGVLLATPVYAGSKIDLVQSDGSIVTIGGVGNAANVTQSTLLAGEDQTNNVIRVEGQFVYSGNKTADTLVKASSGYVHSLVCIGTDAAATAGTIILYDNTAESGTVVLSWAVQAAAYAQPVVFPLNVIMTTGIYLGFTTTNDITCTVIYR